MAKVIERRLPALRSDVVHLRDWLMEQNPHAIYDVNSPWNCMLAQYLIATGKYETVTVFVKEIHVRINDQEYLFTIPEDIKFIAYNGNEFDDYSVNSFHDQFGYALQRANQILDCWVD